MYIFNPINKRLCGITQMGRIEYYIFILFIFITSCTDVVLEDTTEPKDLFEPPVVVELNFKLGYPINPVTGDSNLQLNPTIIGKKFVPGTVSRPLFYNEKVNVEVINVATNIHKVLKRPIRTKVDHETLQRLSTDSVNSAFVLLTSRGDTIPTGVPIKSEGRKVRPVFSKPIEVLPFAYRDNSTINIQYLDMDQGLPVSYVDKIIEDKRGNLWFTTWESGVIRFDGEYFNVLGEEQGLTNIQVRSILEDSKGNLWFGTFDGLNKYDGEFITQFTEKDGLGLHVVSSMVEDRIGNIWFGTEGSGVIKYDGESFTHYTKNEGLIDNNIDEMLEDSKGNLWFSTYGALTKFNGKEFIHYTTEQGLEGDVLISLSQDHNGDIWFGNSEGGVSRFDGEYVTHYAADQGFSDKAVNAILTDSERNVWFGTEGDGVIRYDGKSFTHIATEEGLSNNFINAIYEDGQGSLWFGTDGGGVNRLDHRSFFHFTEKQGFGKSSVQAIAEESDRSLWFGTYGSGLIHYDEITATHYTQETGSPLNWVSSVIKDGRRNLWLGTYEGIIRYDGRTFDHLYDAKGLEGESIISIMEDRKGDLWFGTERGGVSRYDRDSVYNYTTLQGLCDNYVYSIFEDSKYNIWFCTQEGLTCFNGETIINYTVREGLANGWITSVLEDFKGDLWFGSYGGGVCRFDGESFTHYTEKQGLSNNYVTSLTLEDNNVLWIATEKGINRVDLNIRGTGENKNEIYIKTINKQDGLKGEDFFVNCVLSDSKYRIWWGGGKALEMLDLNHQESTEETVAIELQYIEINEQFVNFGDINREFKEDVKFSSIAPFHNYPLNLDLAYSVNHLNFHFSAIDWSSQHKILYSYKMIGLSKGWSEPKGETNADFQSLPHGSYVFKVRAVGANGVWSEPFVYEFVVRPPWWHTWWARIGYLAIAVFIVAIIVRIYVAQHKQRQKELETQVENATKKIKASHKEITDSIIYAKRIQYAILPRIGKIKKQVKGIFVFYSPKDIVSGDFFWTEMVGSKIFLAVADCTGHGVPGAMVSVICSNVLTKSVRELRVYNPARILDKCVELLEERFSHSMETVQDGMDIGLCTIDLKTMTLEYAGANNALYYIREGELNEIKPDKQPVGKYINQHPFASHSVDIRTGDCFYLFSDGYPDQFGGPKNKKFKSKRFKELLLENYKKPMDQQKELLSEAFRAWKGDAEQLDDVCVMGFRV
ncbi:MAG: SpoIIE family protein phosphatase [Flavobacteriales bacterium]|nr:SpoIIE family protein phosphatase [Flavobacteriales bacterium]